MSDGLIAEIKRVPAGWEWLLRSCDDGRFFANVHAPGCLSYCTVNADLTSSSSTTKPLFRRYGGTPEEAMRHAVNAALLAIAIGFGDFELERPDWLIEPQTGCDDV